jgi:hypothetical protein
MSREQRNRSLASSPFGPRNVRLVETAGVTSGLPHRYDDGDLHLAFVDDIEGLVILAVDRPHPPAGHEPLNTTPQPEAPPPSWLTHRLHQFLSFLR